MQYYNNISCIIAAAGYGTRANLGMPKTLYKIDDIPLFIYPIRTIKTLYNLKQIIVTVPRAYSKQFNKYINLYFGNHHNIICIEGKNTRQSSIRKALYNISKKTEYVIIHDAARIYISKKILQKMISLTKLQISNIIPVIDSIDTIKHVSNNKVINTIDRKIHKIIQTPQIFHFKDIFQSHITCDTNSNNATDDASLLERNNIKVHTIQGDIRSFKITNKLDILFAERLLQKYKTQ